MRFRTCSKPTNTRARDERLPQLPLFIYSRLPMNKNIVGAGLVPARMLGKRRAGTRTAATIYLILICASVLLCGILQFNLYPMNIDAEQTRVSADLQSLRRRGVGQTKRQHILFAQNINWHIDRNRLRFVVGKF